MPHPFYFTTDISFFSERDGPTPLRPQVRGPVVLPGTSEKDREEELAHQKSGLTIKCAPGVPLKRKLARILNVDW